MIITNNPKEPQRVTLDIVFKVRHTPFNENHVKAILTNYLSSKGIEFDENNIVI